jgi:SAM-dependent methyltransferase
MTTYWTDPATATQWAKRDGQRELLATARTIATEIVAGEHDGSITVLDIGSGPGDFLGHFLERFPEATGVWSDISPAMAEMARPRLADYADRVTYRIADMADFEALPAAFDVITTSRAVHHLDRDGLRAFYRTAAAHLAPGGWLINLDHVGAAGPWDARLRAARKRLVPRTAEQTPHHHNYPLTSIADHLEALAAAGLTDVDIPWRAYITCLFMARRADA